MSTYNAAVKALIVLESHSPRCPQLATIRDYLDSIPSHIVSAPRTPEEHQAAVMADLSFAGMHRWTPVDVGAPSVDMVTLRKSISADMVKDYERLANARAHILDLKCSDIDTSKPPTLGLLNTQVPRA